MHHVMFDIDGTLIKSNEVDATCFQKAVEKVTGIQINKDWKQYKHVTDAGIVNEHLEENRILERTETTLEIKKEFITELEKTISEKPLKETPGAIAFINELKLKTDIFISLATGGWLESAILKLSSAGFTTSDLPIASSNDHYSRTEIMRVALAFSGNEKSVGCTYIGDGIWDKQACEVLNFNFISVGNHVQHHTSIDNFLNIPEILEILQI